MLAVGGWHSREAVMIHAGDVTIGMEAEGAFVDPVSHA